MRDGDQPPAVAWTVSLNASQVNLWSYQPVTLTATANHDVGPTDYWLSIYDVTSYGPDAGKLVISCSSGTTCTRTFTGAAGTHSYAAYVAGYPLGIGPPPGIKAQSPWVSVSWGDLSWLNPRLALSATTVAVNANVTVTANLTGADIGPTPYYLEIFDATTGSLIRYCGYGLSCSASVSQSSAGTHTYVAYLTVYNAAFPPTGYRQHTANAYVTWSNSDFTVSLSLGGNGWATATVNRDVKSTPLYWITIYDATKGTRLAACGSGTTCTTGLESTTCEDDLVAFVSGLDTAFPPPSIQATSRVITGMRCIN